MKKKLTNLSLVFFSFCFAILLAELLVRAFWPQNLVYNDEEIWRPDDTFGWRRHENSNKKSNFGSGEITIRTDEYGFRINVDERPPNDSSYNVLALGDSFLESVQVESKQTIPKLLQEQLNQSLELNTYFFNSGVSGWNPNHYLLEAKRVIEADEFRIDRALVFLYPANDIVNIAVDSFPPRIKKSAFRLPHGFKKGEWLWGVFYPLNQFLQEHSHLYTLIKSRNQILLVRMGVSANNFSFVFRKRFRDHTGWQTTTDICKRIDELLARHDIPVTFVLIPTVYQVDSEYLRKFRSAYGLEADSLDMEQPNHILNQLFAKDSLSLYDPLETLRQLTATGTQLYGSVDTHFNKEGYQAMADFLFPFLYKELVSQKEIIEN